MTKRELIHALRDVPDNAVLRTSDDLNITGIEVEEYDFAGQRTSTIVYLEDDGDAT